MIATKQKNGNLLQEYVSQRNLLQESLAIIRGEKSFALYSFVVVFPTLLLKIREIKILRQIIIDFVCLYHVDELCDISYHAPPTVLEIGVANNSNYNDFAQVDLQQLPEGIKCSKCWMDNHKSSKCDNEQLCPSCNKGKLSIVPPSAYCEPLPMQIPPITSTPVNYIIIVARMSNNNSLPGD